MASVRSKGAPSSRHAADRMTAPLHARRSCNSPMLTQAEKGRAFRALHERDRAFIIPNPWDVGTARLLAHLGFEALATTSMGYAFSAGLRDNTIVRLWINATVSGIESEQDLL